MSSQISTPDQLKDEAESAYKQGNYLEAARLFEAAAKGYQTGGFIPPAGQTAGDLLLANEMLNNCSVAYLRAGDAGLAYEVVRDTPTVFEKAGDVCRQGKALGNVGAALEALGRSAEAMQAYQKSSELLEQAGEKEHRAYVLQSLSALQLKTGQQFEALATMQSGLEGIQHPSLKQRLLKKMIRIPFSFLSKK
jgi:tetratricopeptide (TPR) repeat protein